MKKTILYALLASLLFSFSPFSYLKAETRKVETVTVQAHPRHPRHPHPRPHRRPPHPPRPKKPVVIIKH